MTKIIDPEIIIRLIRESHPSMVDIFMNGSCYYFSRILLHLFPTAEVFYNMDHIITKIDGKYYDIRGEVIPQGLYLPISEFKPEQIQNLLHYENNN